MRSRPDRHRAGTGGRRVSPVAALAATVVHDAPAVPAGRGTTSADSMPFPVLLRYLRVKAFLTIEDLAEASGVSVRGIGDLERGRRAVPQRRTVVALADGLGLGGEQRETLLAAARTGSGPARALAKAPTFPRAIDDFVGRRAELARLSELAGRDGNRTVVAVTGAPGTGKTTLVLHAARQLADRFTVRLLVDLRGTDDDPPGPAELMLRVLKAFGPAARCPVNAGLQGLSGLYRQALSAQRCLLILDNARDEAQVRALLPGAGTSMVVVTSRRRLAGLPNAHRLPLGELSTAEAVEFLTVLAGPERADADPAAVADVAGHCGCLPLALRVAGNWLTTRTAWTVRSLADRLAHEERRLSALAAGDVRVSAAFDLSYRQLTPAAARMFRRLALIDGPDFGVACAARLTGQEPDDTVGTLEELVDFGLLGGDGDRYRLHDLLRLFARSRLRTEEPAEDAAAVRTALHRWLLETVMAAGRWYEPGRDTADGFRQGAVDLSTEEKAREWLRAEAVNWLAALRAAAAGGEHARVVAVAEALRCSDQWTFWGHWTEIFRTSAGSARVLQGSARVAR